MKKSLLALAALGAFAGAASAQSSVTIFGVVDQSVNWINNGDLDSTTMQSNQLNSNRLGFRGVEDLGGGQRAGFWLEMGMNNDDGIAGGGNGQPTPANGTSLFQRRSTISLFTTIGEFRLGRDYVPSFWNTVFNDVNGANGLGQANNIVSTLGTTATTAQGFNFARVNNSAGYFLPGGLGGLYGQVMVSAGENVAGNKYMGGRLGWAAGPFDVNFAYGKYEVPVGDFEVMNAGGSWDFKFLKAYFFWNNMEWQGASQDVYSFSVGVPIGPGQLRGAYANAKAKGTNPAAVNFDGQKADMASIEYVYDLSKRTALYTTYAVIDNEGGASFTILGGSLGGNAATNPSLRGGKSDGFNVGIRHSF